MVQVCGVSRAGSRSESGAVVVEKTVVVGGVVEVVEVGEVESSAVPQAAATSANTHRFAIKIGYARSRAEIGAAPHQPLTVIEDGGAEVDPSVAPGRLGRRAEENVYLAGHDEAESVNALNRSVDVFDLIGIPENRPSRPHP
jgi:hypothetical protein